MRGKAASYECKVCGRNISVTRTGDLYKEPVYCCGVKTKEIKNSLIKSSVSKKTPRMIKNLTGGLTYCDEVQSKKQNYYVFQSEKSFFLLSLSSQKENAGYFNIVDANAVDYAQKLVNGKGRRASRQNIL